MEKQLFNNLSEYSNFMRSYDYRDVEYENESMPNAYPCVIIMSKQYYEESSSRFYAVAFVYLCDFA